VAKFIAFGLVVTIAWVRLEAPDVALAEAAIGSGLTGALFISSLGRMHELDDALKERSLRAEKPDHEH